MASSFVEIDTNCENTELCFASNQTIAYWASLVTEYSGGVPMEVVIAEWIVEGTYDSTSSGAVCNDPGNAEPGKYEGSGGISFTFSPCKQTKKIPTASSFYGASSSYQGVVNQGEAMAAAYCQIAEAATQTTLTSGGQALKEWATGQGYYELPTGWYNAASAWGESGWSSSHYVYAGGPDGSYLLEAIQYNKLSPAGAPKL